MTTRLLKRATLSRHDGEGYDTGINDYRVVQIFKTEGDKTQPNTYTVCLLRDGKITLISQTGDRGVAFYDFETAVDVLQSEGYRLLQEVTA